MTVNKIPTSKFRLSAVNLYLTYPKCSIELSNFLFLLKEKLASFIVKDYMLVKENHEDGNPHIHAFIKCYKKAEIKNPNYLDIQYDSIVYHGNYQTAKKPNSIIEYLLKGITNKNDERLIFSPGMSNRIDELGVWLEFGKAIIKLAEEGNIPAAINMYKEERPIEFIKYKSRIEKSLQELHMSKLGFNMKFSYSQFIIPDEVKAVIDAYNENKTLIIIGKPGIGKTTWLTSWLGISGKIPLVANNIDAIRFFDPNKHSALIFDDCY